MKTFFFILITICFIYCQINIIDDSNLDNKWGSRWVIFNSRKDDFYSIWREENVHCYDKICSTFKASKSKGFVVFEQRHYIAEVYLKQDVFLPPTSTNVTLKFDLSIITSTTAMQAKSYLKVLLDNYEIICFSNLDSNNNEYKEYIFQIPNEIKGYKTLKFLARQPLEIIKTHWVIDEVYLFVDKL